MKAKVKAFCVTVLLSSCHVLSLQVMCMYVCVFWFWCKSRTSLLLPNRSPCPPMQTCFQSPFLPLLVSISLSHQFASQAGAPVYHSTVLFQSGFHQNITHVLLLQFSVLLFDGVACLSPPPLHMCCACWMFLPDSVSHVFSGKETLSWKSGVWELTLF